MVTLAISILSWVVFHKNRSNVILAHSIASTIGFIFAVISLIWANMVKKNKFNIESINPWISFCSFSSSIIYSTYFLPAALFIWVHLPIHLDYANSTAMRAADWNYYFWNYSIDFVKKEDWRIFLTITILCVIASILFIFMANNVWSLNENSYSAKKWALTIGLISSVVFSFLVVIWKFNNILIFDVIEKEFHFENLGISCWVTFLTMIALVLLLLCSFLSIFKNRLLNFIEG